MMPDIKVLQNTLVQKLSTKLDNPEVVEKKTELINLIAGLLETLNKRICFLYDRDHQIGHSYFLNVTSLDELREAFIDSIIPLLQEYFYGSWEQLCLVLGCPYNFSNGNPRREDDRVLLENSDEYYVAPLLNVDELEEKKVLGLDHPDYENQSTYQINPEFRKAAPVIEKKTSDNNAEGDGGDNDTDDPVLGTFFKNILTEEIFGKVKNREYTRSE
jgi:hypothetical protein